MNRPRLLIIGGAGYLGTELARAARAAGLAVAAPGSGELDVRSLRELPPCDAVVNCAYRQDTHDMWEVNRDGARNVARAAAARDLRLIHLSTDVVFDGARGGYTEDDEPAPVTDYGRSKAEAEVAVAEAHPDALLVRTSLLYGGARPGKHELAAREPGRTFFSDELRCPAEVGDVAAALLELLPADLAGPLHVAGPDAVSRCEFARLIAGDGVRCTTSRDAGVTRPLDCTLDSSRARALLRTRLRGVRVVLG
jgi:dTDP-4-dehydrorhamnose reductase